MFSYSGPMNNVFKSSHATALPTTQGGSVPDWMQHFPTGTFSGRDGRGPYVCEPEAVIARTRQHNGSLDIPVDYDHQIEFSAANGQPAPAAGWIPARPYLFQRDGDIPDEWRRAIVGIVKRHLELDHA